MGSETVSLESLCELIVDCPHSTPEWTDSGVVVLRNQNIRDGVLDLSNPSYTKESDYQFRIKRAAPQAGDIVITREAPMGEVCLIPKGLRCCLGQRQVLLRAKKNVNNEYLFWALQSPFVQNQISWNEGTGTTVSNVRIPVLKALQIPRHIGEEAKIGSALSSIANKITLNRQLNQTLEQMAQALFKSWFVDFDPVIDNALAAGNVIPDDLQDRAERRQLQLAKADHKPLPENIRKLFPSEFELTESLGWVPKGWGVTDLKSLSTKISKGTTPTKSDLEKATDVGAIPFLKVKDISSDGKILHGGLELIPKSISEGALKRSILEKDDLLISIAGSIGRTSVVQKDLHGCNCNQALAFIRLSDLDLHLQLVKLNIQGKRLQDEINSKIVQAVQANFSLTQLGELKILMSSGEVLHSFNALLKPIQLRLNEIEIQSRNLEQLRDTLLPKLISGELRIPEAQAQLEEALA